MNGIQNKITPQICVINPLKRGTVYIFGTTLTNRYCIYEYIKSRLKSGKVCYHSVQNLMTPTMLAENIKITTCRFIILPVACMVVKGGLSLEGGTLAEGVREKGAEEDIPRHGNRVVENATKGGAL